MRLKAKVAFVVLACSAGWTAGAVTQQQEAETLDISSFGEGEVWEFASGDELLRAERVGDVAQVTLRGLGDEEPAPLLACLVGESTCSIKIEEMEGLTRIHLLRETADEKEGLVLDARGDQLTLVGGMAAIASIDTALETRRSREPSGEMAAIVEQTTGSEVVLLRCPEGDTWMQLSDEEATGPHYYCQRHGHQLEIAGGARSTYQKASDPQYR